MWPAGRAEGPAQADLGAAFEHGDDHDVGDADAADQEGDRAEAEEQGGGGGCDGDPGGERGGGLADRDVAGVLGVGRRAEQAGHLAVRGAVRT